MKHQNETVFYSSSEQIELVENGKIVKTKETVDKKSSLKTNVESIIFDNKRKIYVSISYYKYDRLGDGIHYFFNASNLPVVYPTRIGKVKFDIVYLTEAQQIQMGFKNDEGFLNAKQKEELTSVLFNEKEVKTLEQELDSLKNFDLDRLINIVDKLDSINLDQSMDDQKDITVNYLKKLKQIKDTVIEEKINSLI